MSPAMPNTPWPSLLFRGALGALVATAAQAELPLWVVGEQQRQAPVVVRLKVLQVKPVAGDLKVRCKVLQVQRQPPSLGLTEGRVLHLRYATPSQRPA